MPSRNQNNLYTGGAVVFNSQPEVNLYGQVLARQQAKMDAMDQYERSRINSVNDAGLRDIDRKKLDDSLADLRSYYNLNKPKVQKGNSQEAFEYEKKFRSVRDLIAQSKDRAARHNAALEFYHDRLKQDQRLPDDYLIELHNNDMPIGEKYKDPETGQDKEYTPFDITKWASQPNTFVQDKFVKSFADIKRTPNSPTYEKTNDPLKLNEVIEERFDNGAKQVIAARAADKYDNSYSFSAKIKDEISDPVRRKQLSDLFKQEYGTDPTMPSDYAIAYTMEMLQPSVKKVKAVDDKEAIAKMNDKFIRGRMAIQYANAKELIDKRHELTKDDKELDDLWVNSYIEKLTSDALSTPPELLSGADSKVHPIPIDPEMLKALNRGGGGTNAYVPEELYVSENGTYYPVYYSYDKDGKKTFDKTASTPLTSEQMRLALGSKTVTKTKLGREVKGVPAPPKKNTTNKPTEKLHW